MPNVIPRTSWMNVVPDDPSVVARTTDSGVVSVLMTWGPGVQFRVHPLNFHEMDHMTETSWAQKPIAGAAVYREWTGESDELRYVRGELFPYRIGGMTEIEVMDAYRRGGIPNLLATGDGRPLGWFVIEKLTRLHTWISAEGVGQKIGFEAVFARVPVPDPAEYLPQVWEIATQGQGRPNPENFPG